MIRVTVDSRAASPRVNASSSDFRNSSDVRKDTWYWVPYTLTTRLPLNARTRRRDYEGALVRHHEGFGCVHPWPELGDLSLKEEMEALVAGGMTRLSAATLEAVVLDGTARKRKVSLFEHCLPVKSHATLLDVSRKAVEAAVEQGFEAVKVKGSFDRLKELAELLESSPVPVRVDFNESLCAETFVEWCDGLSERAWAQVEFIEDPCPYEAIIWERLRTATGWALAVDRASAEATSGFDIVVVKPAVDAWDRMEPMIEDDGVRFLVTSYMDHPLGQLHAAFQAERLTQQYPDWALSHGLCTHLLFESCPLSDQLGSGPFLQYPDGAGLGLSEALESLEWRTWNP